MRKVFRLIGNTWSLAGGNEELTDVFGGLVMGKEEGG